MTVTADAPAAAPASESTALRPAPTGLAGVLGSGDHKVVGRVWLVASLIHLAIVGVIAALVSAERIDGATFSVFGAEWVGAADSYWRIAGVFLFVLPMTVGIATAIVPLQVGASTLAFPRAAAGAAWAFILGSGLTVASFLMHGGPDGTDRDGAVLFTVAFGLVLVSLVVAWISIATTVLALRTTGMGLRRVPLFSWSALVGGAVWIVTLPVLAGLLVVAYLNARYGSYIDPSPTGTYGRISWAFGTPTVYALVIPAAGFIASVVPVFAQTRHHLHRIALGLIGALAVLSIGVWTIPSLSGAQPFLYKAPWTVVSVAAIVPFLGLAGLWGATIRKGKVVLSSPLLFGVVALLLSLLGLAAGAVQSIKPIETLVDGEAKTRLVGTAWSTSVLGLLMLAAAAAALGGIVYWAPKLLGRRVHEGGARLVALLVLVGAAVGNLADLAAGLLGKPESVLLAPADNVDTIKTLSTVVTIGDAVLVLAGLLFVLLLVQALVKGEAPGDDPWSGHTLEWATASPPPVGNFTSIPAVTSEAPVYDARHAQEAGA
jgi:heme/copper-type cytochrome/quinol oxidase subunit 1